MVKVLTLCSIFDKPRYVIHSFSASGDMKLNWVHLYIVVACHVLWPVFEIQCRTGTKEGTTCHPFPLKGLVQLKMNTSYS
jgi:hypothetical protein